VTFIESYPHPHHPVVHGAADRFVTVQVFQLRPLDADRLIAWAGGGVALADGGVLLVRDDRVVARVALGDFAVLFPTGEVVGVPADGFTQHFTPVDPPEGT
jgi:hypothetical protein